MHQPADIGGEELRLRAGEGEAIIQCVEEPPLGNPALSLDENAMHRGKLHGAAAETDEREQGPYAEPFAQRCAGGGGDAFFFGLAVGWEESSHDVTKQKPRAGVYGRRLGMRRLSFVVPAKARTDTRFLSSDVARIERSEIRVRYESGQKLWANVVGDPGFCCAHPGYIARPRRQR